MRVKALESTRVRSFPSGPAAPPRAVPDGVPPPGRFSAACACGGSCPRCKANTNWPEKSLRLSEAGDPFEREAERVAERVMRTSHPARETRSEEHTSELQSLRHLVCR